LLDFSNAFDTITRTASLGLNFWLRVTCPFSCHLGSVLDSLLLFWFVKTFTLRLQILTAIFALVVTQILRSDCMYVMHLKVLWWADCTGQIHLARTVPVRYTFGWDCIGQIHRWSAGTSSFHRYFR